MESLTPDQIEGADFEIVDRGYDPLEVEVFLRKTAKQLREVLKSPQESEAERARPYEALGREMGELLQHASDTAEHLKSSVEAEAARKQQEGEREARRHLEEANRTRRRIEAEAAEIREEARSQSERTKHQVDQFRRLAEAEASLLRQDARKAAKRTKDEAKKRAESILAAAEYDAAERTRESERRLRRLQQAEAVIQERIKALQTRLRSLEAQAKHALPSTDSVRSEGSEGSAIEVEPRTTIHIDASGDAPP